MRARARRPRLGERGKKGEGGKRGKGQVGEVVLHFYVFTGCILWFCLLNTPGWAEGWIFSRPMMRFDALIFDILVRCPYSLFLLEKADDTFASKQRRVHNHQEKADVSLQYAAIARTQPISVIDPIFISRQGCFSFIKTCLQRMSEWGGERSAVVEHHQPCLRSHVRFCVSLHLQALDLIDHIMGNKRPEAIKPLVDYFRGDS